MLMLHEVHLIIFCVQAR